MTVIRTESDAPRRFPAPVTEPSTHPSRGNSGRSVPTRHQDADTGQVNDLYPTPAYDFSEPLLDQDALASWLNVSVSSVKKWTQSGPESGRIPRFYRVNGVVRFRQVDVQAWMESRAVR